LNFVVKLKENALFRKALLDTNYYFFAQVGSKLLGLLIIPFLVRILSIEEFAHYDIFLMSASIATTLTVLGVDSGISIMIADHKNNQRLINFLFTFSLLFSICAVLILWLISLFIFPLIEKVKDIIPYINYLFLYILFNLISYQVFNFIRWIGRAKSASIIGFISYFFGVLLGFSMIYFNPKPVLVDYLFGITIGNFIGAIASLTISYKYLSLKLIPDYIVYLKELMKISLPFVPNYLASNLMMMTDRLVVISILGEKSLGIYALANRFAQIPNFVINIITRGFQPVMYLNYKEIDGSALIKKVYDYSHYVLLFILPIMYVLATPIVRIFGGIKYHDAIPLIPVITMSTMVYGIMGLNGMGFTIQRKTYLITLISLLSIILNTSINFILGMYFGIKGITIGVLIVSCVIGFIYSLKSEKLYNFKYNLKVTAFFYILIILISTLLISYI
jgi:O-antigen/teichoic acid export membrane protein